MVELKEVGFLVFSINASGDIDLGGDEGGEYCCELFPAILIACSAAYLAAASTCSILDGLVDLDLRLDGEGERSVLDWVFVSKSFTGVFLSFCRFSASLLVSLYSCIDDDGCLTFLEYLLFSSYSEFSWLDNGERDRDLDAVRSLSCLLSRSLIFWTPSLLLVERKISDVFADSPLTRSVIGKIKVEKNHH